MTESSLHRCSVADTTCVVTSAEDEQNIEGVTKEEVLAVDRTVSRSRERGAAGTRSANNVSTALWKLRRTSPA